MKDKLKKNNNKNPGFILAFTLILVAVLLLMSVSTARIIAKEMFFSELVNNSRSAYFAADSGIECAQYIDNVIRDDSLAISLIINSVTGNANPNFINNANNNVFFSTSSIIGNISSLDSVTCASGDGTDNKIFTQNSDSKNAGHVSSRDDVIQNLSNKKSSYYISGDAYRATTTFGLVLWDDEDNYMCDIVDFVKEKNAGNDLTHSFSITSTGYSDCNPLNKNRVIRTIYRYSTD